jgi:hypothetical protein
MGKDREGTYHPPKGKPSGIGKSEGLGLRKSLDPDQLEQDERMTERYTIGEDELSPDVHMRHPNRNTSKGKDHHTPLEDSIEKSKQQMFIEELDTVKPEELPGVLTKEIFNDLASFSAECCVSILLPTHASGVEINEQVDSTNFKTALQDVEKKLSEKKANQLLIQKILQPAYDLLRDDSFWLKLSDGLAVYMSENTFKYIKLPAAPIQETMVNSSFLVAPLIPFVSRSEYFYLLSISKKRAKLFKADYFGMQFIPVDELPYGVDDVVHFENKDDQQLFRTGGRGGTGGANFHGIGAGKPDDKTNVGMYLKEVDRTLWEAVLREEHAPLLLAGVEYQLPIYRSVSAYKNIWPDAMTGNHDYDNIPTLYARAKEIMQPFFDEKRDKALNDYGNKSATALTSSIIEDVIPAAYYGQIAQLFVEEHAHIWGTFDEAANELKLHPEKQEHSECLVDKAVIKTIQTGGEVFIMPKDKMPQDSPLAAIMRY